MSEYCKPKVVHVGAYKSSKPVRKGVRKGKPKGIAGRLRCHYIPHMPVYRIAPSYASYACAQYACIYQFAGMVKIVYGSREDMERLSHFFIFFIKKKNSENL